VHPAAELVSEKTLDVHGDEFDLKLRKAQLNPEKT
jgi:hypothetical protein